MVRGRDACWEHCVLVDATRQKVRCNYCHREFSGGVYRMKFHLAQIKNKDIVPCAEVPDDVRDHIQSILNTPKKQKTPKKPKMDKTVANGQQNSSSASGGLHPNHGSSGQHGSTCPSLLFPHPSPSEQPATDDAQKQKLDDADKKIAAIKSLLYLERFWKSAREAVSVSESLVKILRIVDGDMPAMGYMYEGIERAKGAIKAYYKGIEEKYMPIWDIIDRRWNMQLHSPLHAAAAFLNPSIFYNPNFKIDLRMRNGFQEAMLKMATMDKDKIEITKEHPVYINAQGALGTDFAIMGRTLNAPGRDGKCKPIIFDEIDVSSEWPTESEPSVPLLDDSWLDNLPLECRGSP
ncbi:hypothetical protein GOBAR_DD32762 [Gossypium barbadense]|nr:hypothetical protein GOBAR_DD32762 [Gossypium barbadense]